MGHRGIFQKFVFSCVFSLVFFWASFCFGRHPEINTLCDALLSKPKDIACVKVSGARGLYIPLESLHDAEANFKSLRTTKNPDFQQHELVSSAKYAEEINRRNGERLLFVASLDSRSVPGFDGVILKNDAPVANYQVKTIPKGSVLVKELGEAIQKAQTYSRLESWLVAFNLAVHDKTGELILIHRSSGDLAERMFGLIKKGLHVFGLAPLEQRPCRLVFDLRKASRWPNPAALDSIREIVRGAQPWVESVTLMHGDRIEEIR